ncbi:hypothetical protein N7495_005175 [Penicillium taxi]|uniref:uncharacterized protein n=1 Tax=Penicillium taxi TaxID=168475 RepID=UPI0025457098|nr:uncharacterized protein N7495_005175 [Penicillium taxi]KAJ5893484.1 hypothetical protein N7495_005175 [Penicillium taxi]
MATTSVLVYLVIVLGLKKFYEKYLTRISSASNQTGSTQPSSVISATTATATTITTTTSTTTSTSTSTTTLPPITSLPTCGQTCFNNMLAEYETLGCNSADPSCLCENIDFYYGIWDCVNEACGTAVASTVIAYESAYYASATSTVTIPTTTSPSIITTTSTGTGSVPSPVQTGIATYCDSYYKVQSGDTCDIIEQTYDISAADFLAWNPAVGSSCKNLELNVYVCIGITGKN